MQHSLLFKNLLVGLVALLGIYATITGDISFAGPRHRVLSYAEIMVEQARAVGTGLASFEIPSVPVSLPYFDTPAAAKNASEASKSVTAMETAMPMKAPVVSNEHYFVQLASLSEEDEIAAEVSRLSRTHASFLHGRRLNFQRADLGSKGAFHRLLVGPFEAHPEATRFCRDLKMAGKDCLVLKTNTDRVRPL